MSLAYPLLTGWLANESGLSLLTGWLANESGLSLTDKVAGIL